jgi:hypothetical protein
MYLLRALVVIRSLFGVATIENTQELTALESVLAVRVFTGQECFAIQHSEQRAVFELIHIVARGPFSSDALIHGCQDLASGSWIFLVKMCDDNFLNWKQTLH